MSTAISTRHPFSLPMLDTMARPPPHGHGWGHDAYPQHARPHAAYYHHDAVPRERPLLPGPSTLLSSAAQLSSPLPAAAASREHPPYSTATRSPYYSEYATPSPVGQTPPQFPSSDFHQASRAMQPRRPVDVRLSPGQSSISSGRSDELEHPAYFHQPINAISLAPWPQRTPTQNRRILPKGRQQSDASDRSLSQGPPDAHRSAWPSRTFYPHPASPPSRMLASPRAEMAPMRITSLLSNDDDDEDNSRATTTVAETASPSVTGQSLHKLSIRQQPVAARSCGFGERDRRVIDPPPILEMTIEDPDASPEELQEKLRASEYVVQCTIWDEEGKFEMSALPDDFKQQRRLMGTLVASPFVGIDETGKEGCFFCFPDLSCRSPGAFTLKFTLVKVFGANLPPPAPGNSFRVPQLDSIMSDVFNVYNAKDFPGMSPSTALTRRLKEQGCTISIKKGVTHGKEERKPGALAHVREESEHDFEDAEEDDDEGSARAKKRSRKE